MITVDVQYSKRRRFSAMLSIAENRHLIVKVPLNFTINYIADLLSGHQPFLKKSLTITAVSHKWPIRNGSELYIFGRKLPLLFGTETKLTLNSFSIKTRKREMSQKEFYRCISPFLLDHISSSISRNQKNMSIAKVGTVRLKLVKSQWGSCTNKGNLSFNKKLIHYPADCIEYVVIHELAHIFEHNHSRNFWAIVQKHWPNYKTDRKQLRQRSFG